MWPKVVLSARKERLKWRLHFCEETSIIDVLVYDVKRREVEKSVLIYHIMQMNM